MRKTSTRSDRRTIKIINAVQTKTPQDEEAEVLYQVILQKQKSGFELSDLIPSDVHTFELIKYILLKPIKLPNEIYIIKLYLFNLEKFMKVFKTLSENTPLDDLISKIGGQLKCEFVPQNKVICKQGDKGDKCYVVLQGIISILIQKEFLEKIGEVDYIKYLIRLCIFNESDLMNRVLLGNRSRFLIEEKDIIVLFALFRIYNYYINHLGSRFKFFLDFINNEKQAEELINAKYECNLSSILQFFPLDELQLIEVYDYFENVYNSVIEGFNQKIIVKKGADNSIEQHKRDAYEVILNHNDNSNYNEQIYTGSSEEYCDRFVPFIGQSRPMPKELKLFTYVEVVALKEGNIFGDVALQKISQRRTATVITKTDCVFGTLTKGAYDLCLKGTQDKVRLWNVFFFLNGPLFKEVNQSIFESKYFNFFKQEELKRGQQLFNANDSMSTIYFIRQGELEVSSKLTFKQLNHIIRSLGGSLHEEIEKKFANESIQFENYYNRQSHLFRFCFLKENEIAGLDDFIISNNYFCNCYCSSSKVNVFSLEKQFYLNLISDKQIKSNIEEYVAKKRKVFLDLLLSVRKVMISNEIHKINKDEKELCELYYNQKKKEKINKVKTTNSIVSKSNIFNRNLETLNSISESERKSKSRNRNIFLQTTASSNRAKMPKLIHRSLNLTKRSLRNSQKKHQYHDIIVNEKLMHSITSRNKQNRLKVNTCLSQMYCPPKRHATLSPTEEIKNNPILLNNLNQTISAASIPFTFSRSKKVILPQSSSSGYREYKTKYTESRSIRTDTFFYKNLHVFDNILNQNNLPKAKQGIIDCLVLDKWEESNNNDNNFK